MSITYQAATIPKDKATLKILKKEAISELVADILQDIFKPTEKSKTLKLVYGGKDAPFYDNLNNTIFIPYQFIQDIKKRFIDNKYSETGISINDAVMDTLMHTVLHEAAHALISTHDLPIVAKEEDTADSLATMLLIEYFDDGEEIALTAADLFGLESDDVEKFDEEDLGRAQSKCSKILYNRLLCLW